MLKNNFYMMQENYDGNYALFYNENKYKTNRCDFCGSLNVYIENKDDVLKGHFIGKKQGDFYCDKRLVVSLKLIEILETENITGFSVKDFICTGWYDRYKKPIIINDNNYKELYVYGKGGYVEKNTGEIMDKCEHCGTIGWKFRYDLTGLGVGTEWDGSDMFYYDNWPGVLIVTEKVKNVIENNKIKNTCFKNISDYHPGLSY